MVIGQGSEKGAEMTLDAGWAARWMRQGAAAIVEARDDLVELDRRIGDGDHGENLSRGFRAVVDRLEALPEPPASVGEVLRLTATTLMSTVGGASGPLYGTAFLRAAKVSDLPHLDAKAVVALLEGALEGVATRGRSQVGEKTMVDAWSPAVDHAVEAAAAGAGPAQVLQAAATGAELGAEATVDLIATKGRASYLGERSAGVKDPGAASTVLLLRAAAEAADG